MTTAQKNAKAKFKQAIEYRKKTGVSLKEAFAHIYGKKVGSVAKKTVKTKTAKKSATKKVGALKLKPNEMRLGLLSSKIGKTVKKKKAKKPSEQSILNKIHIVKKGVDKLDEAQHRHMMGAVNKSVLEDIKKSIIDIKKVEFYIDRHNLAIKNKNNKASDKQILKRQLTQLKKYLAEKKTHLRELKKSL